MQERLNELHLQRGRLLERIAQQRQTLAVQVRPIAHTLHVGDRLSDWITQAKLFALQHPLSVAMAVGTVVVLRPARVLRLARRSFFAWRTWTTLRASLPALVARFL